MSPETLGALQAQVAARKQAIVARDTADAEAQAIRDKHGWGDDVKDTDATPARKQDMAELRAAEGRWKQAHTEVTKTGEAIGEAGAEAWVRAKFKDAVPVFGVGKPGARGEFDQVWKVTVDGKTRYLVIEAKGGSSQLGVRGSAEGPAMQGSRPISTASSKRWRTRAARTGPARASSKPHSTATPSTIFWCAPTRRGAAT